MSKSLGNFFTIRDILEKYDPEVVRFFILSAHYRSPIDFSDQNLEDAKSGLSRFYEVLKSADEILSRYPVPSKAPCPTIKDEEREVYDRIELLEEKFAEAMDDDFNTALALGHLFDAVRGLNRLIGEQRFDDCPLSLAVLSDGARKLRSLGAVLGFFGSDPVAWLEKQKSAGLEGGDLTSEASEALIAELKQARADKDFARSDESRDELEAKGVILLDSREGTTWKLK